MSNFVEQNSIETSFSSADNWIILSSVDANIKKKIEEKGVALKDWNIDIYRGILTGFNEAFIVSESVKNELIAADPKSAELIRPILRGRDINRYGYNFANLWLINVHNGLKDKNIPPIDINEYPSIKAHLDKYWDSLKKRYDKGDTPYNLRNCVYLDDFFEQKIMYNDISQRLSFTLVPENVFCVNTVYFIKNNAHIKYLLACLNSPVIDWYYRTLSVQLGEKAVRMFSIYVEKIPIPIINMDQEIEINNLIDSLHKTTLDLDKERLEKEINNFVSNLYGLTEEEYLYILDKYQRL